MAGVPHGLLDLRPPAAGELAAFTATFHTASSTPNESRQFFAPRRDIPAGDDGNTPLPSLGLGASHARIMGRAEAFAHRVHREGLPVARLWENHSALVSLGLNSKGKPGLWLVQKTH